jgi:hypothetical protein
LGASLQHLGYRLEEMDVMGWMKTKCLSIIDMMPILMNDTQRFLMVTTFGHP